MPLFLRIAGSLLLVLSMFVCSCSFEKRLYQPGFQVEGYWSKSHRIAENNVLPLEKGSARVENEEWRITSREAHASLKSEVYGTGENENSDVITNERELLADNNPTSALATGSNEISRSSKHFAIARSSHVHSPFSLPHSPVSPDTLKKTFKPQPQYREVDPIGKYAVITVLAGVALQKLAGMLTWFEVAVPLSFGPAIFIPAAIIALVGVGLSVYSAYRVRKFPEKYKKNEWGKVALAILGWQVLMSVLFAWLLV
jgi:hypothetical protein